MLLWILTSVLAVIVLAVAVALFSPLCVTFGGTVRDDRNSVRLLGHWMHPAILRVWYSSDERRAEALVLGRFRVSKKPVEKGAETVRSEPPGGAEERGAKEEKRAGGFGAEPPREARHQPGDWSPPGPQEKPDMPAAADREKTKEKDERPGGKRAEEEPPRGSPEAGAAGERVSEEGGFKGLRRRLRENKVVFVLRQKRLRNGALRCVGRVLRTTLHIIRFDRLRLHVRAGSSDPYEMGVAYGYFIGARNGLALHRRHDVQLDFEPVFDRGEVLELDGDVRARTSVARALLPVAAALFTFPYLSAFLVWRRMKKRGMLRKKVG
jgi:hypothetical protein